MGVRVWGECGWGERETKAQKDMEMTKVHRRKRQREIEMERKGREKVIEERNKKRLR